MGITKQKLATLDLETLQEAVKTLLDSRSQTEMTYEDAYEFVFKSCARDEWDRLIDLTQWKPPTS